MLFRRHDEPRVEHAEGVEDAFAQEVGILHARGALDEDAEHVDGITVAVGAARYVRERELADPFDRLIVADGIDLDDFATVKDQRHDAAEVAAIDRGLKRRSDPFETGRGGFAGGCIRGSGSECREECPSGRAGLDLFACQALPSAR